MKKRTIVVSACLIACFVLFSTNAHAAWYRCVVKQAVFWSDGTIRLKFTPGTGETRFTGTVQGFIDTTKPGGKNMLASVLTAISMGSEIAVLTASVPTYEPALEVTGVGLDGP